MGMVKDISEVPACVKDALSNTFIYGVDWEDHCLARGQLTHRALWQMRKMSRKYAGERSIKLEEAKKPARGGFELMMQLAGHRNLSQQHTPKVIGAWADYFTYTRQFGQIKSSLFQTGVHLIVFGWYTKKGIMRLRTTVVPHPHMLGDDELKQVAAIFLSEESRNFPDTLPNEFNLNPI